MMKTLRAIHDDYDQGRESPVALTRRYLAESRKHCRAGLNAYLALCEDRAVRQAEAAERMIRESGGKVPREAKPLLGIPVAIKDVFTVEGVPTTCASRILETYVPPYTATCVRRLEDAGAVILGKANMDEFAMGSSNENSAFGAVGHPTHQGRVPGGSSGGSAAAVRAGLCVAALGTDTGGSIRLPASYCGVVGAKPTYGSVSRYGMIAFASSLDQAGPLAASVEDAAVILDVMAGPDPRDSTSAPVGKGSWAKASARQPDWGRLRIGVPREYMGAGIASDVGARVREALAWFEAKGARLVDVSLPHTSYGVAVYYVVALCEASSNLARFDGVRFGSRPPSTANARDLASFYRGVRAQFGAEVKRRIILGTFALSSGYYDAYYGRACRVRRLIRRDFEQAFSQVDVIAAPVAPTTAFKAGEKVSDPLQMYLMDALTIPASLAGLPALSVPCGEGEGGLPVGLQLIGPHFGEERIFSVARAYEERG